jgi:hypothetical protein
MSRPKSLLANLGLALVVTVALLLAVEAAARMVVSRRVARPFTTRGSIVRFHPTLGWDHPPNAEAWLHRPEYDVLLKFNSKGLRGPERPYQKPAGAFRALLLGDSFTDGYTVSEEKSVRARLEGELRSRGCALAEVFNAGAIGYSTDQEYLFYQQEGRKYAPDVVVVMFCSNDLYFNTTGEQGKPYFDLDGENLVLRNSPVPPPDRGGWVRSPEPRPLRIKPWKGSMALRLLSDRTQAGNPALHRWLARFGAVEPTKVEAIPYDMWPMGKDHPREVNDMWARTAAILEALKQAVEKDGGRLLLFYIPDRSEVNDRAWELTRAMYSLGPRWSRDRVLERLRKTTEVLGIPLVDPREPLRAAEAGRTPAHFPEDGHWTEVGHEIAAREIAAALAREGMSRCSPAP